MNGVESRGTSAAGTNTYFIHCPATNRVKIGKARNPARRLISLSTAASTPLALLAVIDRDVESDLHMLFDACRVRGEWFEAWPSLVAIIKGLNRSARIVADKVDEPRERMRRYRAYRGPKIYKSYWDHELLLRRLADSLGLPFAAALASPLGGRPC